MRRWRGVPSFGTRSITAPSGFANSRARSLNRGEPVAPRGPRADESHPNPNAATKRHKEAQKDRIVFAALLASRVRLWGGPLGSAIDLDSAVRPNRKDHKERFSQRNEHHWIAHLLGAAPNVGASVNSRSVIFAQLSLQTLHFVHGSARSGTLTADHTDSTDGEPRNPCPSVKSVVHPSAPSVAAEPRQALCGSTAVVRIEGNRAEPKAFEGWLCREGGEKREAKGTHRLGARAGPDFASPRSPLSQVPPRPSRSRPSPGRRPGGVERRACRADGGPPGCRP